MKKRSGWAKGIFLGGTSALMLVLLGCTPAQTNVQQAPTTVAVKIPVITALGETKENQNKGGLLISIAPASYQVKEEVQHTLQNATPNFGENLLKPHTAIRFVQENWNPVYKADPERLTFLVTINNNMPRVFRGAGTVVQFNFGGKLAATTQDLYQELLNVIVPPRGQVQIKVYGPLISEVPENNKIGLYFYDVVTKIDNAGNVTEKQNFEWYWDYKTRMEQKEAHPPRINRHWM
jgi:hypothetical protein